MIDLEGLEEKVSFQEQRGGIIVKIKPSDSNENYLSKIDPRIGEFKIFLDITESSDFDQANAVGNRKKSRKYLTFYDCTKESPEFADINPDVAAFYLQLGYSCIQEHSEIVIFGS